MLQNDSLRAVYLEVVVAQVEYPQHAVEAQQTGEVGRIGGQQLVAAEVQLSQRPAQPQRRHCAADPTRVDKTWFQASVKLAFTPR